MRISLVDLLGARGHRIATGVQVKEQWSGWAIDMNRQPDILYYVLVTLELLDGIDSVCHDIYQADGRLADVTPWLAVNV